MSLVLAQQFAAKGKKPRSAETARKFAAADLLPNKTTKGDSPTRRQICYIMCARETLVKMVKCRKLCRDWGRFSSPAEKVRWDTFVHFRSALSGYSKRWFYAAVASVDL